MRLFRLKCRPLRQLRPETGESLAKFKNYSQLPNFFYSHFLVHFLLTSGSTELIYDYIVVLCSKISCPPG